MLPLPLRRAAAIPYQYVSPGVGRCRPAFTSTRRLVTLAIESSCDDTSVAVAELLPSGTSPRLKVHFHEKVTANNDAYAGIHPIVALQSHHVSLAPLVQKALAQCPRPDIVAATRGPGMRSNLSVGLNTAKGLALAWDVPFIGVHHMQAHALTPRLVAAMNPAKLGDLAPKPQFPFLSVLVSGGHTMLIDSSGLVKHKILAETQDIALGDCLDKACRAILPRDAIKMPYGRALEDFAFPQGASDYHYVAPAKRANELERRTTKWGWSLGPPLAESKGGDKSSRRMVYSFAGLLSWVERFMKNRSIVPLSEVADTGCPEAMSDDERRDMAQEVQRVAFEHLASRVLLHLSDPSKPTIHAVVVSGGVASNKYLRHVLRSILDIRGYKHVSLEFPPVDLCTDNALMIAWAAIEMWQAGYQTTLDVEPIRRWSMDPAADDGGILGVGGWTHQTQHPNKTEDPTV